jgi:N-methylhydantoinase A
MSAESSCYPSIPDDKLATSTDPVSGRVTKNRGAGVPEDTRTDSDKQVAVAARAGADIGGTFTDVAAVDADGYLHIGKRLTTHGSEGDGVLAALADTAADLSGPESILAHGTTLVINALLERKGARVGLVVTEGFGDVIEGGRSSRPEIFNLTFRRDPVIVPPELRFEVAERVYASGEVAVQPSLDEIDALAERLREAEVEAVAVAFLNSYVQPANEQLVAERLRMRLPNLTVTVSSDISRQWREAERFTTAAANAYVAPVADRYIARLLDGLRSDGFTGEFVVLDSNGGALALEPARRFPVKVVESGPVAGVIGARELAAKFDIENMVTFDMGGTTAKSCLIEDGRYASTELYWINGYERGFALQVRSVDVTEVGAGGGSIAWCDESGRLLVGPRSAGSQPGPACYGGGGTEPTVTDANLYCGRLDPQNFVGSLQLDMAAAEAAIKRLADQIGMDPHRAALGIIKLANLSMAAAVRRQTLERGRDPREFTMVAFGGAGPMHACEVALECGIGQVLIPVHPGHFSAIGMLGVNLRLERSEILSTRLHDLDSTRLRGIVGRIADELEKELFFGSDGSLRVGELRVEWAAALRYVGQSQTLLTRLAGSPDGSVPDNVAELLRAEFEHEYGRRYGHTDELSEIEAVELEVTVERVLPRPSILASDVSAGPRGEITSYFDLDSGPVTSAVIPRGSLAVGDTFTGPAVIYEQGATSVIPPGARGVVREGGNLLIDLRAVAVPGA